MLRLRPARVSVVGRVAALIWLAFCPSTVWAQENNTLQAPNSRVVVDLPSGYVPSELFSGFTNDSTETSIVIAEMPVEAFAQLKSAFTVEALKAKGFIGPVSGQLQRQDEHLYFRAGQMTGEEEYSKFIVVIKDKAGVALLTANVPKRIIAAGKVKAEEIEAVLKGARLVAAKLEVAPVFTATYLGPFKQATASLGQTKLFTLDGKAQRTPGEKSVMLIIAPSIDKRPLGDLPAFAERAYVDIAGVTGLKSEASTPIKAAGREGIETVGQGKDDKTGEDVLVVQSVLAGPEGGYVRAIMQAPAAERETYLAEFRKVIEGLQLNP